MPTRSRSWKLSGVPPPKDMKLPKMLMARPPDFLDVDRMKVELVGKKKEIKDFLQYAIL
jgi:hypothetical protein